MKKYFSASEGFTLVEVIISIALLSLASVVVLRLFITSVDLNQSSRYSDIASVVAANQLEMLQPLTTLDAVENTFGVLSTQDDDYAIIQSLDQQFNQTINTAEEAYTLELTLYSRDIPGLYDVTVVVVSIADDQILASYNSKHYFNGEVADLD